MKSVIDKYNFNDAVQLLQHRKIKLVISNQVIASSYELLPAQVFRIKNRRDDRPLGWTFIQVKEIEELADSKLMRGEPHINGCILIPDELGGE